MCKTGAASWLSIRGRSGRMCRPLSSEESASDLGLHSLQPQGTCVLEPELLQPRKLPGPPAHAAGHAVTASGLHVRSLRPHSAEVQRPDLLLGGCGAACADGAVAREDVCGALPQPLALARRQPHWRRQLHPGRVLAHEVQQRARLRAVDLISQAGNSTGRQPLCRRWRSAHGRAAACNTTLLRSALSCHLLHSQQGIASL